VPKLGGIGLPTLRLLVRLLIEEDEVSLGLEELLVLIFCW